MEIDEEDFKLLAERYFRLLQGDAFDDEIEETLEMLKKYGLELDY